MKTLVSGVAAYMGKRSTRRNTRLLVKLILTLVLLIAAYSVSFHLLMEREGQHHSWITGADILDRGDAFGGGVSVDPDAVHAH